MSGGSGAGEERAGGRAVAGGADLPPNFRVVDHPLIRHKISLLREVDTDRKLFRELVEEISLLMAYEVTADLETRTRPVETPLESTRGEFVEGERLVLVPILRAGLGMVDGVLRLIPTMGVGHIGLQREHETLEPVDYYFKIPPDPASRRFVVTDPMLATGGSASAAIQYLKDSGAVDLRIMVLVAAPEGVRRLASEHPDVPVFAAALDRQLDENGYILPGLGDAGDRLYGT